MRNPVTHDNHCSLLDGPYSERDSTTYGVNRKSILNDILHFHVASGQMPQDLMHVILEGVLPLEMKLMFKTFIYEKHYFELSTLNERLESFSYGRSESRTKHPKLFERKNILGDSSLGLSGKLHSFALSYTHTRTNTEIRTHAYTCAHTHIHT